MPTVHIIYHAIDLDGKCSGAIAYHAAKTLFSGFNRVLRGLDYGWPFDEFSTIYPGDAVIMLDFALYEPGDKYVRMHRISDIVGPGNFIWIDHHKTSIAEASSGKFIVDNCVPGHARGITQEAYKSACALAWEFFHDTRMPEFIELLSAWDCWIWKTLFPADQEKVQNLQYGLNSVTNYPDFEVWDSLLNEPILADSYIERGAIIREYLDLQDRQNLPKLAFGTRLDGHPAIAINRRCSSESFRHLLSDQVAPLLISFIREHSAWRVTLYRGPTGQDIDVSAIATQHGGGGHPGAGGFQCQELPFPLAWAHPWTHGHEQVGTGLPQLRTPIPSGVAR